MQHHRSTKDATSSACSLACLLLLWSPVEANCDNSSLRNFVHVHLHHTNTASTVTCNWPALTNFYAINAHWANWLSCQEHLWLLQLVCILWPYFRGGWQMFQFSFQNFQLLLPHLCAASLIISWLKSRAPLSLAPAGNKVEQMHLSTVGFLTWLWNATHMTPCKCTIHNFSFKIHECIGNAHVPCFWCIGTWLKALISWCQAHGDQLMYIGDMAILSQNSNKLWSWILEPVEQCLLWDLDMTWGSCAGCVPSNLCFYHTSVQLLGMDLEVGWGAGLGEQELWRVMSLTHGSKP